MSAKACLTKSRLEGSPASESVRELTFSRMTRSGCCFLTMFRTYQNVDPVVPVPLWMHAFLRLWCMLSLLASLHENPAIIKLTFSTSCLHPETSSNAPPCWHKSAASTKILGGPKFRHTHSLFQRTNSQDHRWSKQTSRPVAVPMAARS